MLLNMLFYGDWFITNRSTIEICTICQSANKAYVKVIEVCCNSICTDPVNLYIYLHKTEQFTGPER